MLGFLIPEIDNSAAGARAKSDNNVAELIANGKILLSDGDDIDYKEVKIGRQDEYELQTATYDMLKRSLQRLPERLYTKLREIVTAFSDDFCTRLGKDPPVNDPPMKIEFDGGGRPFKVQQRSNSPAQ